MNGQRQVAGGADWWLSFAYRARHSSKGHSNGPFARVDREYGSHPVQSVHTAPDAFAGVILDLALLGVKLHPSAGETGSQDVGRQAFQGGSFFAYDRTTTEDLKSRRFPGAQPAGKFPAQPPLVYCRQEFQGSEHRPASSVPRRAAGVACWLDLPGLAEEFPQVQLDTQRSMTTSTK